MLPTVQTMHRKCSALLSEGVETDGLYRFRSERMTRFGDLENCAHDNQTVKVLETTNSSFVMMRIIYSDYMNRTVFVF